MANELDNEIQGIQEEVALILPSLTDDAERELAHATELSNQWRVLVPPIVDGQPVVGTVLVARANFTHRTGHDVLAPNVGRIKRECCCISGSWWVVWAAKGCWFKGPGCKKKADPARSRTCNLLLRRQTRYPLRHRTCVEGSRSDGYKRDHGLHHFEIIIWDPS